VRTARIRRLRVVVLPLALGGAFAAAGGVAHGWTAAVAMMVIMIPAAVVNYVQVRRGGDRAAMMIGGGADERQALIRRKAMALGAAVMYGAALISGVVVIALQGVGHWSNYGPIALVVAVGTVTYLWGGRDSERAAMMIGGRADERQALIRTRAMALSGYAMAAAVLIGALVEEALGHPFRSYWPLALTLVAGAVGYLAGEAKYGADLGADYAPGAGRKRANSADE
jgi:hypothetical protein